MAQAAQEMREAFFESQKGLREPVLFERECEPGVYEGYTENYTPVRMQSEKDLCGLVVPVLIAGARGDCCTAGPVC
jgi:threonylcarbamoyladenosine tRNA methylthiotransferase MtaB